MYCNYIILKYSVQFIKEERKLNKNTIFYFETIGNFKDLFFTPLSLINLIDN